VKLLIAIIQPAKVNAIRDMLVDVEVERMSVFDAQGYARQRGQLELFRDDIKNIRLRQKVVLEIAVNDDFVDRTVEAITRGARSGPEGKIGDGKIFVLPVADAIQIGPSARGPEAI